MPLKDSSAYNIQFHQGKAILIDTLSFEEYQEGEPWVAYRQFCQHFLAPLALMALKDIRLGRLLRIYLDGIPLDSASRLRPFRSWLRFPLLTHIHLHAMTQKHFEGKKLSTRRRVPRMGLLGIIDNLKSTVNNLQWKPRNVGWRNYYSETNYSQEALEHKKRIVGGFLDRSAPSKVWDLGANTGMFSRIVSGKGIRTVAFDGDPAAVEGNYLSCRERGETNLLPVLMDLTNPSPSIGWSNKERLSLLERGPADTVLALALIHHLAIANNVLRCCPSKTTSKPFRKSMADGWKERWRKQLIDESFWIWTVQKVLSMASKKPLPTTVISDAPATIPCFASTSSEIAKVPCFGPATFTARIVGRIC